MADRTDNSEKPKVGVYGAESTETVSETAGSADTRPDENKSGGIPTWAIALIIVVLVILALIFFL